MVKARKKSTRKKATRKPTSKKIKPLRETKIACVVKRAGHEEIFDERKVYASCYYAARASHLKSGDAEKLCEGVSKDIKKWIKTSACVTAHQIHVQVAKSLRKYNKDVAFMYNTHRDIS